jgi:hypothetical protein
MHMQQGAIIVSTATRTQLFIISRRHLDIVEEKWLKVVQEYYEQREKYADCDPDLI